MSKTLMVGTGFSGVGRISLLGCKRLNNISQLIKSLFANNEQGFAYDPNDLTTMFQDAAGTVPVTGAGQPVGLMLDKSRGLVLGGERWNPALTTTSGQSSKLGDNKYRIYSPDGAASQVSCGTGTTGKWYEITLTIESIVSGAVTTDFSNSPSWSSTGVKKFKGFLLSPAITFKRSGTTDAVISNISIKELKGNHAYQTTSAARPVLGRMPEGGIRNILVSSGDRTHSSWTHQGGTKVLNVLDAKGTYKATRFSGASLSPPYILGTKAAKEGPHTLRIQVKSGSSNYTSALVMLRNNTTVVNYSTGVIDLVTGRITGIGWSSKELPNGFWECTFTQSTGISLDDSFNVYFGRTGITDSNFDIIVGEVQLESGTQATPYQETRGLTDVTESGKKDIYFLAFDGADDFLQTNNIDFTATDKVSLFAGVRKLSDVSSAVLCEVGDGVVSTSFGLLAPSALGANKFDARVTPLSQGSRTTDIMFNAPVSAVVAMIGTRAGSEVTGQLRVNAATQPSVKLASVATTFLNAALYIGRRGGTSLPFNGHIYSLIGVARLTTDSETIALEKSIAKNVGVTL